MNNFNDSFLFIHFISVASGKHRPRPGNAVPHISGIAAHLTSRLDLGHMKSRSLDAGPRAWPSAIHPHTIHIRWRMTQKSIVKWEIWLCAQPGACKIFVYSAAWRLRLSRISPIWHDNSFKRFSVVAGVFVVTLRNLSISFTLPLLSLHLFWIRLKRKSVFYCAR